jgi:hypothetical protein
MACGIRVQPARVALGVDSILLHHPCLCIAMAAAKISKPPHVQVTPRSIATRKARLVTFGRISTSRVPRRSIWGPQRQPSTTPRAHLVRLMQSVHMRLMGVHAAQRQTDCTAGD